jgi:hypothetical protein
MKLNMYIWNDCAPVTNLHLGRHEMTVLQLWCYIYIWNDCGLVMKLHIWNYCSDEASHTLYEMTARQWWRFVNIANEMSQTDGLLLIYCPLVIDQTLWTSTYSINIHITIFNWLAGLPQPVHTPMTGPLRPPTCIYTKDGLPRPACTPDTDLPRPMFTANTGLPRAMYVHA